jgi:DHA2 family multidrug resistance protein
VTTLVAPVAGPLLGGWITDNFSWPWIFYINVPVGLAAAAITWSIYHKRETPRVKRPIDGVGLALIVLWVGSMQIMLDKGKELDWFHSTTILVLAILMIVGFAVFLAWELTDEHPVVDIRLFARRNFLFGTTALSIAYGLFFGNVVLLPLWLQQWMGYTATAAGFALAPVGVFAILLTPLVGKKVGTWDPRWMATLAFCVFALVLWMRSNFTPQTDIGTILIPTLIQGCAMAFFFIPLTTLALSGLPPERIPAAAGLSNFVRIAAGAMGTSITTTLWDNRATLHHAHLTEQLGQGSTALANATSALGQVGFGSDAALASINRLIDVQAFTRAADDIFIASSVGFLLLIGTIWLTKRPPKLAHGPGPGDAGGAH